MSHHISDLEIPAGCRRVVVDLDESTGDARAVYRLDCHGQAEAAPLDLGLILMLLRLVCTVFRIPVLCDLLDQFPFAKPAKDKP